MSNGWEEIMPTVTLYQEGIRIAVEQAVPFTGWVAASIKCMLATSSYTPSQLHTSYANVSAYEISGGGYVLGGTTLTSKTIVTATNQLRMDAADVSWTNLLVKPRFAVVYDSTNATASQRTLMGYMDLGNLKGGKLRIRWPGTGVLVLTVENAIGFP